jgi:hypothetical protein
VAVSLACTYLGGAIWHRENVRAGFERTSFKTTPENLRDRADLAALLRQIGPTDKVAASDRLVPHVSNRDDAYDLVHGTFDADWVLFEIGIAGDERRNAADCLADGTFGVVDERGRLVLAKRGAPPSGSVEVLERFGR